jgi:hypothetical protein
LQSSDFAPYLNQSFRIHVESAEPLQAELVEVTEKGSEVAGEKESSERKTFSVVFRCVKDKQFVQKIYSVEHDKMGSLELFLVPIGPDEKGMLYEAVFN